MHNLSSATELQIQDLVDRYLGAVVCRLVVEGAVDLSGSELVRCLSGCVCGSEMIALAAEFIKRGLITNNSMLAMQAA
jgi:hypothetical protein